MTGVAWSLWRRDTFIALRNLWRRWIGMILLRWWSRLVQPIFWSIAVMSMTSWSAYLFYVSFEDDSQLSLCWLELGDMYLYIVLGYGTELLFCCWSKFKVKGTTKAVIFPSNANVVHQRFNIIIATRILYESIEFCKWIVLDLSVLENKSTWIRFHC